VLSAAYFDHATAPGPVGRLGAGCPACCSAIRRRRAHQGGFGFYQVDALWKSGANLNVIGCRYVVGNESTVTRNAGHWFVDMQPSYKIIDNVELFRLARYLFDRHYLS